MRDVELVKKLLRNLISLAFALLATALYNVLASAPDQQLAIAIGSFVALSVALLAVYLLDHHWPAFLKKWRWFAKSPNPRLTVPNAITASRAALAGCVAFALLTGYIDTGYWLYLAGLATDLLDGMVARAIGGVTDWGKSFDAQVDVLFNGATGMALFWTFLRRGSLFGTCALALLLALFVVRLQWAPAGLLPKYFSGLVRLVYFVLFLVFWPSPARAWPLAAGTLIFLFGAWYEHKVMHLAHHTASLHIDDRPPELENPSLGVPPSDRRGEVRHQAE